MQWKSKIPLLITAGKQFLDEFFIIPYWWIYPYMTLECSKVEKYLICLEGGNIITDATRNMRQ